MAATCEQMSTCTKLLIGLSP